MPDRSAEFVGSIPEYYDRGLGPVLFADFADDIVRRTAASDPARVLELAAGTGIVTRKLRDGLARTAHLTATDLNPPMLEIARLKFAAGEQVDFRPADATALPFPDSAFDAIVCQFGVMFFPDKDKAYREAYRALRPGGRYVFNVWDSHEYNRFARLTHQVVGGFFPSDPPQFYRVPFGYHSVDAIRDALMRAGFEGVESAIIAKEKEIPDFSRFAQALIYGNPIVDQVRSRGGANPDLIVEAIEARFRHEFGNGRMPLQAIVFEARKR
jgi:SAM-dependent methyltransferase